MPFRIRHDFAEICFTDDDISCCSASTLSRYILALTLLPGYPESKGDLSAQLSILAQAGKRSQVPELATPLSVQMRQVLVKQQQPLANRISVLRKKLSLYWLTLLVVCDFRLVRLPCLMA